MARHIDITHVGSMPRGEELTPLLKARDAGEPYDASEFEEKVSVAVNAAVAKQIAALVYVDAFLPEDSEALWDIATDWERKHYIDAQRDAPGLVAPFPDAPAHLTRHPLLTLTEPVRVTAVSASIKQKTYIYATRGAPKTFGKFYERTKTAKGSRTHALNTSHNVMADDPDGLTMLLLAEAR